MREKTAPKTYLRAKRGFSIIEVLFATLIFSVGLVSVSNLMLESLKNSADSRNVVIAAQLAQEGVELVRNFRDNNIAKGNIAFNGMPYNMELCPLAGGLVGGVFVKNCAIVADQTLYYDAVAGYNHNLVGSETIFKRNITIEGMDPHKLRSLVFWGRDMPLTTSACTLANKCVYVELALNEQGWK